MIIVELTGGLGNQMFQYAAGRALANKLNTELRLDHAFFETNFTNTTITPRKYELDAFNIDLKAPRYELLKVRLSRFIPKTLKSDKFYIDVNEKCAYKTDTIFPKSNNLYLTGYYQSEKYFQSIREIIKKEFSFKPPLQENIQLINHIATKKNSVGILVRRDDFITTNIDQSLDLRYFERAINEISLRVKDPFFFIFTIGDTAWSRGLLKFSKNMEIIENNNPNMCGFEKMRLMSLCNNNIIPNSSYGWWSAWLNNNPEKLIIAPRKWHFDENINQMIIDQRILKTWISL